VREALRQASEAGLNVLRTFAHTTDDNFPFQVRTPAPLVDSCYHPMVQSSIGCPYRKARQCWFTASQASPGVFNENTFRALDWLLDEARLHGLRVVLSFIDNWKYPGEWRAQTAPVKPACTCQAPSSTALLGCTQVDSLLRCAAVMCRWRR
jgi:endo-1,4-beta-mannosidase